MNVRIFVLFNSYWKNKVGSFLLFGVRKRYCEIDGRNLTAVLCLGRSGYSPAKVPRILCGDLAKRSFMTDILHLCSGIIVGYRFTLKSL